MADPNPPASLGVRPPRPQSTVRTTVRSPAADDGQALCPAVFLDRDGTLMEEVNYCSNPADVALFPGTVEALRALKEVGFKLIIITNQSGIGRGMFTTEDFHAVQAELIQQLGEGLIDACYFCPDAPDENSTRRKPAPGMVFEAMREHRINPMTSFFVGDKAADIVCGRRAGTKTVLVETGYGFDQAFSKADHTVKDIVEASELILNSLNG